MTNNPFSPLGAIIEYTPSLNETLICTGIWAFGLMLYTLFLRMTVPILQGRMTRANEGRPERVDGSNVVANPVPAAAANAR